MRDKQAHSGIRRVVRALRHRNFRLFFGGQLISLSGTWMQQIAIGWLVYRLTASPFLLGLVAFSGQIPAFFMAPVAGVMADRWNRHRVLIITQTLSMFQAAFLAVLVLTGAVQVWHVVILSLFIGTVNAFDIPMRQAFFIEMIEDREDLGNAIALNSSVVNSARFIGPVIGGVIIAAGGEGACFLLNALSYLAVIAALLAMRISRKEKAPSGRHVIEELKDGFFYAFGFAPIRSLLLLTGLISFTGAPYGVLMPVFARDILRGGPHTLGFLMASAGIGALIGTVYLAWRRGVAELGMIIVLAALILGTGLIVFSVSRQPWLSFFLIMFVGMGMMVCLASCNTIIQTVVDDNKRGRVMSFYTMAFMGMAPLGSLAAGYAASRIGGPMTLVIGGIFCIIGSGILARRLAALP